LDHLALIDHLEGAFREHSGNIQGTFKEHSGNIYQQYATVSRCCRHVFLDHLALIDHLEGAFREHSRNIQGTFKEHSGNIQGTFREHSGNIYQQYATVSRCCRHVFLDHLVLTDHLEGEGKRGLGGVSG
jgi:DNA-directed RNA polymerase subunit N (RpoN/RPB10)